nr:hypothetical protein [Pseudomonas sp. NFPP33]
MKFFVLDKHVITGMISTDIDMHLKSSRFIPATREAVTTYNSWIAEHPGQRPTLQDVYEREKISVTPPSKQPKASTTSVSTSKPSTRKALVNQFKQHIKNR